MKWIKLLLGGVLGTAVASALADGRGYEPRTVPISVGVVAFSANDNLVRDVYTFYAMDRRTDLKPLGLSFRNPYAPSGATRNQAEYWFVDVGRLTDAQLVRYRILLLSRTSWSGMTPAIREKLRRFVDSGGTLWIDVPQQGVSVNNNRLWFPQVSLVANRGAIDIVNLNHPLLRGYYTLTPAEVASLGVRGRGFGGGALDDSANQPPLQIVTGIRGARPIPVIAAATYGSGRIIVSAAGVAAAINAPFVRSNGSIPPRAAEFRMEAVPELELKFAYNIVRWAGAGNSDAFNPRRANAVADQYSAPLSVRWLDPDTNYTLQNGTPVIYGGLVFVASNNKLICYDAVPKRDLDGDGRSDDGRLDLEQGKNFDKVWEVELGGQSSPPIVVETREGLQVVVVVGAEARGYWGLPRDAQGRVPEQGQLVWRLPSPVSGSAPTTADGQIPAPILVDNILLVVPSYHQVGTQSTAGFFAILLDNPRNPTVVQATGSVFPREWFQPRLTPVGEWLLPPVAGYVPNYGQGGGNDLVIYLGVRRDTGGAGQVQQGVQAFWLGAKGEQLIPEVDANNTYTGRLRTRLSGRGTRIAGLQESRSGIFTADRSNPLHPRVYRVSRDGEFVDFTDNCTFNSQGDVLIDRLLFDGSYTYLIDYYIDWAYSSNVSVMFRSFASLPAETGATGVPPQRLRGFTLAPNGVLYIATGTDSTDPEFANGNIIALQEQLPPTQQAARGGSKVLWRWQSHGGYQQIVPGPQSSNSTITVLPSTLYNEPNRQFMQFVGRIFAFSHRFIPNPDATPQRQWMNFTFKGAPIYYDGAVYAIGEGRVRIGPVGSPINFPYTILVALDAEPEQFIIELNAPVSNSGDIRISQRDYGRSGPNPTTNIAASMLVYSPTSSNPDAKVDFNTGQIRITSFAQAGGGGQIGLLENVLSISQPVLVNVGGNAPAWIDPDVVPGNWNNLRWYAVFLLLQAQANPVLVGDVIYIPAQSVNPFNQDETYGGILGVATDPYRLQLDMLAQHKAQAGVVPRLDPNNPLQYQSIVRWPFIDDLIFRLQEGANPQAFLEELFRRFRNAFQLEAVSPIAVGEGLLVVSGNGLRAYSRQTTIIADENRLLEVDTAGRVVWSTENTQLEFYTGSIVPSKGRYPITPNARVYRYGENELLIVEPERNRVAIIDRAGAEIRTITRFIPDRIAIRNADDQVEGVLDLRDEAWAQQNRLPGSNYISGAPETLRNPTDVTVWTEYVPARRNPYVNRQEWEYWIHYTIADAGNARVVDIVDRYTVDLRTFTVGPPVEWAYQQGNETRRVPMLGVLYWMTPAQRLERNYRYVSAQRFEYWDGQTTRIGFATLVQNAAVSAFEAAMSNTPNSNSAPTPQDPLTPEAGMITLQLIVNGRDQTLYIRRMILPDGRIVPILAPVALDTAKRSASGTGSAGLYLLVTTSTGVYELQVPLTGNISDTLPVTWMLPNEVYTNLMRRLVGGSPLAIDSEGNLRRPILFKPRQARYLDNGNVLIVNSYNGTTLVLSNNREQVQEFPGEVFELNAKEYWENYSQNQNNPDPNRYNGYIVWSTLDRPELSGSSPLRKPSSADRGGF